MLTCLVHVLFTFYIQGVLKLKSAKGLIFRAVVTIVECISDCYPDGTLQGLCVVAGYGFEEDIAVLNVHAAGRTMLCETHGLWKIRGCGGNPLPGIQFSDCSQRLKGFGFFF